MIDVQKELAGLPPEVAAQLRVGKTGTPRQDQIMEIVRECGGQADVDQLVIGMWTMFKVAIKRENVSTITTTLKNSGRLEKVNRGTFRLPAAELELKRASTPEPAEEKESDVETFDCANCSREVVVNPSLNYHSIDEDLFCRRQCMDEFKAEKRDEQQQPSNQEAAPAGKNVFTRCGNCDAVIPANDVGKVKFEDIDVCSHLCKREMKKAMDNE